MGRCPQTRLWLVNSARSTPQVILRDPGLRWGPGYPTGGGLTRDDVLHFALAPRTGTVARLVQLVYERGEWRVSEVPSRNGGSYVGLASAGQAVAIGDVSTVPKTGFDFNSVFLVRSIDGGTSWAAPELVSRSGETPANDLLTLMAPDGKAHLVWLSEAVKEPLANTRGELVGDMLPESSVSRRHKSMARATTRLSATLLDA